jgi:hypothetical protein
MMLIVVVHRLIRLVIPPVPDTVLVVATSVSENAGGKPTTVRWNLRLGVSDVAGKPMISRLESVR